MDRKTISIVASAYFLPLSHQGMGGSALTAPSGSQRSVTQPTRETGAERVVRTKLYGGPRDGEIFERAAARDLIVAFDLDGDHLYAVDPDHPDVADYVGFKASFSWQDFEDEFAAYVGDGIAASHSWSA